MNQPLAEARKGRPTTNRRFLFALLPMLLLLLTPMSTSAAGGQWRIEVKGGGTLMSGSPFSLYNTSHGAYVRYEVRCDWCGINLGWTQVSRYNFVVVRRAGSGAVKYGELVALRETNSHGGYLRYASRDAGINLKWSKTPVYEWRIRGGASGTPVKNNARVSLYNTQNPTPDIYPWCGKKGANVVYGWRPFGINLVWDPPGIWEGNGIPVSVIKKYVPFGTDLNNVAC